MKLCLDLIKDSCLLDLYFETIFWLLEKKFEFPSFRFERTTIYAN